MMLNTGTSIIGPTRRVYARRVKGHFDPSLLTLRTIKEPVHLTGLNVAPVYHTTLLEAETLNLCATNGV